MSEKIDTLLLKAKRSSFKIVELDTRYKNAMLMDMAKALRKNKAQIIKENKKDIALARKNEKLDSYVDRLMLDDKRIKAMAQSLEEIAKLKDPVGETIDQWSRPNGLKITKVKVPIGVIFIIYEARPNVTSDCIGLCLKSSNVVILRGGSDCLNSNKAIVNVLNKSSKKFINEDLFYFIDDTDRAVVDYILKKGGDSIDLVIPRGGESLIKKVVATSRIPVIKHYKGVCHVYVDKQADVGKAVKIAVNAKAQRPSVCNSMETLLVHRDIAKTFLPKVYEEFQTEGVELRGCERTVNILPDIKKATEKDFYAEYLDLILSVKIVDDIDQAIDHINTYGSMHTDSIVSNSVRNIKKFLTNVHSACVFSNISTRFSDGGVFGLGAEMGISTDKLHARGPMGVADLTTYKYVVYGNGQIRE